MLPQLLNRKTRSGIVITSSSASVLPLPAMALYSATKVYEKYLAEALNFELKEKVDVISYEPGMVCSNMTKLSEENSKTITAKRAAEVCFRDLGISPATHGAFRHDKETFMLNLTPKSWFYKMMVGFAPMHKKAMEEKYGKKEADKANEGKN